MKYERFESYHDEKLREIAYKVVGICLEHNLTRSEWRQLINLINYQAAEQNGKLPLFVQD